MADGDRVIGQLVSTFQAADLNIENEQSSMLQEFSKNTTNGLDQMETWEDLDLLSSKYKPLDDYLSESNTGIIILIRPSTKQIDDSSYVYNYKDKIISFKIDSNEVLENIIPFKYYGTEYTNKTGQTVINGQTVNVLDFTNLDETNGGIYISLKSVPNNTTAIRMLYYNNSSNLENSVGYIAQNSIRPAGLKTKMKKFNGNILPSEFKIQSKKLTSFQQNFR